MKQRPQAGLKPPRKPKVILVPVCRQICISSLDCSSLLGAIAMRCSAHTAGKTILLQDTNGQIAGSACVTYYSVLSYCWNKQCAYGAQTVRIPGITLPLVLAFGTSSWPIGKAAESDTTAASVLQSALISSAWPFNCTKHTEHT